MLRNDTVDEWEEAGEPSRGQRPNEDEIIAETAAGDPITRYQDALALPNMTGDIQAIPLYAGQSAGLAKSIPSAEMLVVELATETHDVLEQATSLLDE